MGTKQILLETYRTNGSKVFTGRDRGIEVRTKSSIDQMEKEADAVEIVVPNDIRSINPSFLEEFLFNVVISLGEERFYKKFKFVASGRYDIESDLKEAVESILREENALT